MVAHLNDKIDKINRMGIIKDGDVIIDIGSNDGTSLRAYERDEYNLIGIDPTAE